MQLSAERRHGRRCGYRRHRHRQQSHRQPQRRHRHRPGRAGAKAALAYAQRKTRGEEQDAIAKAAGPLDVGAVAHWNVKHQLPIESDAQGQVTVSRLIGGVGLACKEVVFSIDTPAEKPGADPVREFYITTVCRDGEQWRWASAEPATARWGSLQ
jgi:hypothetical protein